VHLPKAVFFTKGVGKHKEKLQSFEAALRQAGIERYNLVSVSSIYPPGCRILTRDKGLSYLEPGQIVYTVMARNDTNEPGRQLVASIGLAVPAGGNTYGYLSEHHAFGETAKKAGDYSEDLAATMLATTLGIPFDPDQAWDERKQVYRTSQRVFHSRNITQSARGDSGGLWTTVVAAAVFIIGDEDNG